MYILFTTRPSGPVCGVTKTFPNNFFASSTISFFFTNFTPPAFPLPPACIWAFKTNWSVFRSLILSIIPSELNIITPSVVGAPKSFKISFA